MNEKRKVIIEKIALLIILVIITVILIFQYFQIESLKSYIANLINQVEVSIDDYHYSIEDFSSSLQV